jgi:hypothetical protein
VYISLFNILNFMLMFNVWDFFFFEWVPKIGRINFMSVCSYPSENSCCVILVVEILQNVQRNWSFYTYVQVQNNMWELTSTAIFIY